MIRVNGTRPSPTFRKQFGLIQTMPRFTTTVVGTMGARATTTRPSLTTRRPSNSIRRTPMRYNNRGVCYRGKGDYDRAIADYSKRPSDLIRNTPWRTTTAVCATMILATTTRPSPTTQKSSDSIQKIPRPIGAGGTPTSERGGWIRPSPTTPRPSDSVRNGTARGITSSVVNVLL